MENSPQKEFFEIIKRQLPTGSSLVHSIAKTLSMSESGAYKKITNISKLSFEEVIILCKRYGISFDSFTSDADKSLSPYFFYSDTIRYEPRSYNEFLAGFLESSQMLDRTRENYKVSTFVNEVPMMHYLQFPFLLYFKLFAWNRTNWKIKRYGRDYNQSHYFDDVELTRTVRKLQDHYDSYDSVDIWNKQIFTNTLQQLNYYIKAGVFQSKDQIYAVFNDLKKLFRHLKDVAEKGKKISFSSGQQKSDMKIYLNEVVISSEIIYVTKDDYRVVYHAYDTPNYIRSDDPRVCDHMEGWLEKVINQSILISGQGERERDQTFRAFEKELEHYGEKLDAYVKAYND